MVGCEGDTTRALPHISNQSRSGISTSTKYLCTSHPRLPASAFSFLSHVASSTIGLQHRSREKKRFPTTRVSHWLVPVRIPKGSGQALPSPALSSIRAALDIDIASDDTFVTNLLKPGAPRASSLATTNRPDYPHIVDLPGPAQSETSRPKRAMFTSMQSIGSKLFGSPYKQSPLQTSPEKHSSPGPARPGREDADSRAYSSTAPAITREMTESDEERASNDGNSRSGSPEAAEEPAADDDYVDPFANAVPFSTQHVEEAAPASDASEADEASSSKNKKQKKGRKRKSKGKAVADEDSDPALPTPTTSGPASNTEADGAASAAKSSKKKRKRKSASSDPIEPQDSRSAKKRKTRKPLEDIEDTEMDTQPNEVVPDSPTNQLIAENDNDSDLDLDLTLPTEAQNSQLQSVSRQLFQYSKGHATTATSASEDSVDDHSMSAEEISPSSPSVIAQRRRSMSRGSQISAFRQNLSRESTSIYDRISEAAESGEEGPLPEPVIDLPGQAEKPADKEALASGALLDSQSQELDFADQLPPSSQPPREDSPSEDGDSVEAKDDAADVVMADAVDDSNDQQQLPRLPVSSVQTGFHAINSPRNPITYSNKGSRTAAATPGRGRRRAVTASVDGSEPNMPSSAVRSARSTASKKQRAKPTFFDKPASDHSDSEQAEEPREQAEEPREQAAEGEEVEEEESGNQGDGEDEPVPEPQSTKRSTRNAPKKLSAAKAPKTKASAPEKKAKTPRAKAPASEKKKARAPKTLKEPKEPTASRQPAAVKEYTKGAFTPQELKLLSETLTKFRDNKAMTQEQLIALIHKKHQRGSKSENRTPINIDEFNEFWAFVTAAFPHRKRQKVICVTRQEFHPYKRRGGNWTADEDAKLALLHDKYNGAWSLMAEEMSRTANDLRDRWRNYVVSGRLPEERKTWSEEEEQELVQCVIKSVRRIKKGVDGLTRPANTLIHWHTVSEMMGFKRSRLQCLKKWDQLDIDLEAYPDIHEILRRPRDTWALDKARLHVREMTPEAKYELVLALNEGAFGDDSSIKWQNLVDVKFRKAHPRAALQLLWHRIKRQVPGHEDKTVRDCSRWLLDQANASIAGAKFIAGGDEDGDTDDEKQVIKTRTAAAAEKRTPRKKSTTKKAPSNRSKIQSAERVEDSGSDGEGADDTQVDGTQLDETQMEDTQMENTQMEDTQMEDTQLDQADDSEPDDTQVDESMADDTAMTDNDTPQPSQRLGRLGGMRNLLAPLSSQVPEPSPGKKIVRLSRGKSAKERVSTGEGDEEEDSQATPSQLDVRKIPDRKQEKKEAAKKRKSSGSRVRSVRSMDSVQNSDVDEDMPEIHVPLSTQPSRFKKAKVHGNWARKTGSNVLPGEPVELTEEVMAELEAANTSSRSVTGEDEGGEAIEAPPVKKRRRQKKQSEVAETPA
ncbi:DNA-binding protein REB1 [Colletotrichum sidae]|uniref:DNA-binding protein REB1 n=1 Tax=Colletotrichum sidae TaxID=1347389 RepID=A0A4R8TQ81_9PEZI|nr:DNA-binding protein REB1 [Colletotrichum sidae]